MDVEALNGPATAKLLRKLQGYLSRAKKIDPRWRPRAIEGVRFYFDGQWDEEDKDALEGRNQPVITNNRIKPVVRIVLGQMLGRPFDWVAKPQGKNDDDLSEAATSALKYVANRSNMRHVLKMVYFDALTYGVGWCQVGPYVRSRDPRREIVQHRHIDPREIRLDPNSHEPDIADARWIIWSRKLDLADAKRQWPRSTDYLSHQAGDQDPNLQGHDSAAGGVTVVEGPVGTTPQPSAWDQLSEWNQLDKGDGVEDGVRQVVVHEVWEVVQEMVWFVEHADGQPTEIPDPEKTEEGLRAILEPGVMRYYQGEAPKVYRHVFCGALLLESERSQHKHDRLPFVPCFYERDEHGDPVSFVETLKDMQREVNHRRSKGLYELANDQLMIDPRVLDRMKLTVDQAAKHAQDPGAVWFAAPGEVSYLSKGDRAGSQFEVMRHSEESIQKNAGANDHIMGYDGPAESGRSKEISLAQGQTAMRDAEENLLTFHRILGELTLSDIQTFHTGEWVIRVTDEVGKDKLIKINERETDPATGQTRVIRDINALAFEIEIDAMPWTVTLRQRAFEAISEMAGQETDPFIRMQLRRLAFMVGDIPEKSKVLEVLDGAARQFQMMVQAQQQAQMAQQQATVQQDAASVQAQLPAAPGAPIGGVA